MYEASTQAKARLQAQENGKFALFFYAYGCASLRFTRSLTPKASVVGVHAPCFRSLFQSEAKCEAVDTKWFYILMQMKLIITGMILL